MVTEIRSVTTQNVKEILALQIADEQKGFIESIPECLEEAEEDQRFIPLGLYQNQIAVGFAMYGVFNGELWLDRFLIDEHVQGQGLGRHFLKKIIVALQQKYPCTEIILSVYPNNSGAIHLYESIGFAFTGNSDGNEKIMRLTRQVDTNLEL
ncbi:GNAT family N-acetyltransferase [Ornithinibacillus gellani]|uniref:GNAT family N-acetyltransferase n=1 Tax=Ornithinibacillus gellani TaxID=2293253 RepID=UPI000F49EE97|nr:GNAT family N-acetyltransferase [Ornithinibacillus gellani]